MAKKINDVHIMGVICKNLYSYYIVVANNLHEAIK